MGCDGLHHVSHIQLVPGFGITALHAPLFLHPQLQRSYPRIDAKDGRKRHCHQRCTRCRLSAHDHGIPASGRGAYPSQSQRRIGVAISNSPALHSHSRRSNAGSERGPWFSCTVSSLLSGAAGLHDERDLLHGHRRHHVPSTRPLPIAASNMAMDSKACLLGQEFLQMAVMALTGCSEAHRQQIGEVGRWSRRTGRTAGQALDEVRGSWTGADAPRPRCRRYWMGCSRPHSAERPPLQSHAGIGGGEADTGIGRLAVAFLP